MQFINQNLCIEYSELVGAGIMTESNYKYHKAQGNIEIYGRGCKGNPVMIGFESLPKTVKQAVIDRYGNPYEYARKQPVLNLLRTDDVARAFFHQYVLPDGRHLPNGLVNGGDYDPAKDYQGRYVRQAEWFNAIEVALKDKRALKDMLQLESTEDFWMTVCELHQHDQPINPKLPNSINRLKIKYRKYLADGYEALVDVHRFTNDNARKVTDSIEQLILALYCQQKNPYMADVCKEYAAFMAGERVVVDLGSGAVFEPKDYYVDGKPYVMSVATVKYYLNLPHNQVLLAKHRVSDYEFRMKVRPHHNRKAPIYALSKITMDDTASPFKMPNGKRPATYKIFDVASQALIGMAMVQDERPNAQLIRQCIKNMMRTIVQNGWGMPHQIEVENAINKSLVSKKDDDGNVLPDILAAGAVFPSVYFCAPKNPQEKAAEHFIKTIKYSYQKHREGFQARPFARLDANRLNEDRDKVVYEYEQILTMEMQDAEAYNNDLHPKQDLYPGKTRWQVLQENQNPNLPQPNLPLVVPFVGDKVAHTKITRGYLSVKGVKMQLPSGEMAAELHGETLTAYYLPEADGSISKAYLYRHAEYVCEAVPVERYSSARIERTKDDYVIRAEQQQYIQDFDAAIARMKDKLPVVGVLDAQRAADVTAEAAADSGEIAVNEQETSNEDTSYEQPYDIDEWIRKNM